MSEKPKRPVVCVYSPVCRAASLILKLKSGFLSNDAQDGLTGRKWNPRHTTGYSTLFLDMDVVKIHRKQQEKQLDRKLQGKG